LPDWRQAVYEEFFEQGDRERAVGHTPQAILDRSKARELPKMQVCLCVARY
jgi:hypothetical protein